MIGTKTKKITIYPLRFRNKFHSTGFVSPFHRIIKGAINRDNMTQAESIQSTETDDNTSSNLMDKNDSYGIDMKNFYSGDRMTENGVSSVENLEKQLSLIAEADRYNAGILSEKLKKKKKLVELAEKRKQKLLEDQIVQWLAETDELDEVPAEYREEVENYYATHPNEVNRKDVEARRLARQKKEEEKRLEQFRNAEHFKDWYGHGWRAPRLHKLVKPIYHFNKHYSQKPEDVVEQQKADLNERQQIYKEQQTEQRGVAPPNEMVKRAMPCTAEPLSIRLSMFSNDNPANNLRLAPKRGYFILTPKSY